MILRGLHFLGLRFLDVLLVFSPDCFAVIHATVADFV